MNTTSPVPLPAQLTPLSPDQFTGPSGTGGTATTTGTPPTVVSFTASDRATLQTARELLSEARAKLASADQNVKAAGLQQIVAVHSYLIGFCDGRGLINTAPVKPGFESIFGDYAKPDLDTALDELDAALAGMLAADETRMPAALQGALGDALIGLGTGLVAGGLLALLI